MLTVGDKLIAEGAVILDVRTPQEFGASHFEGSRNISVQTLEQRLSELNKAKKIVVCCAAGGRSAKAYSILKNSGFENLQDVGAWTNLKKSESSKNEPGWFKRLIMRF